jgi:hypothetical protein
MALTYVFTGAPREHSPVNLCYLCVKSVLPHPSVHRLLQIWTDAPHVQLESDQAERFR